ncbi:hypothetical protein C7M51_04407 (plasmid) [Mixta intestinalis]|uniref:Uncharacterized protein n=1 Tax=Mixta intestinalis TaxID=1615494 RepID=A0A6P1Q501_9GAMM|nr:hypothetical protein C7M51_04407 [Mixta intestinalis]
MIKEAVAEIATNTPVSGPEGPLTRRYAPARLRQSVTTPTAHRRICEADSGSGLAG